MKICAAWSSGTMVSTWRSSGLQNPKRYNMNLHRRRNLEFGQQYATNNAETDE
jgi:hypothetical protein